MNAGDLGVVATDVLLLTGEEVAALRGMGFDVSEGLTYICANHPAASALKTIRECREQEPKPGEFRIRNAQLVDDQLLVEAEYQPFSPVRYIKQTIQILDYGEDD